MLLSQDRTSLWDARLTAAVALVLLPLIPIARLPLALSFVLLRIAPAEAS